MIYLFATQDARVEEFLLHATGQPDSRKRQACLFLRKQHRASMPINVRMPALASDMEAATLVKWMFKEGDDIKAGDVLAEFSSSGKPGQIKAAAAGTLNRRSGRRRPSKSQGSDRHSRHQERIWFGCRSRASVPRTCSTRTSNCNFVKQRRLG